MGKNILSILKKNEDQFLSLLKIGATAAKRKLSDPLCINQEIKYAIDEAYSLKIGPFNLSGTLQGINTVQLFNSASEDIDKEGVLAVASSPASIVPFSETEPIIKYSFSFVANTSSSGGSELLRFGVDARSELRSVVYLKHQKDENVIRAMVADISDMKFPFDKKDVLELQIGEAVRFTARAHLAATFNFEFTDLFTSGLSQLSQILNTDLISLDVGVGFSAGINAVIRDFFDITIGKTGSNKFEISFAKSIARQIEGNLGAQVSVGFRDPKKVSKAIDSQWNTLIQTISDKLLKDDQELKTITQKVARLAEDGKLLDSLQLTPIEREIIDLLSKKLNIEESASQLQVLAQKLSTLRADVGQAIETGIEAKLRAGIAYEYSRYQSSEEVLRASVSPSIIEKFHKDLIRFRTETLLVASAFHSKKDLDIRQYWREDNLLKSRRWGISLGIGKFKVGGTNFQEIERKITFRTDQHKKVAYQGKGGYEGQGFLGTKNRWWGLLDAGMTRFSREIEPRVSEFDFGIQLIYEHNERRFRKPEKSKLFGLVDRAACWDIIPEHRIDQVSNDLWTTLYEDLDKKKRNRQINFRYSLNISPKAFQKLRLRIQSVFEKFPRQQLKQFSSAMAKVVPYLDDIEGRSNITIRKKIYTPVWEAFLGGNENEFFPSLFSSTKVTELVGKTQSILMAQGRQDEADFEGRYTLHKGPAGTIGDIIEKNSILGSHWQSFSDGLLTLTQSISNNTGNDYDSLIQDIFKDIKRIWSTSYGVLACGTFLLGLTGNDPSIMKHIDRQLEIDFLDDKNEVRTIFFRRQ